jgi:hypothetical protein
MPQTQTQPQSQITERMSWRAVRICDGGRAVSCEHFNTMEDAYNYYLPNIQRQNEEGWHIVLWHFVKDHFKLNLNATALKIGWNEELNPEEMEKIESIYIQRVFDFNDPIPQE